MPPFDDTIVYTQPREIPASYVREGDDVATYAGGMLAAIAKSVKAADWRHEIAWIHVSKYSREDAGILTAAGEVLPAPFDQEVVVRERVSTYA